MKINKIYILIGISLILLVAILYSRSEQPFPFYPYIDTIFSKDFTWGKFEKVQEGMSREEVIQLLGQPLSKHDWGNPPTRKCWQYSKDGKLEPIADFSWYLAQVCFTKGRVDSKPVTEFGD